MATVDTTLNLLVPIHLEALVVNNNSNYWKDTSLALAKLNANRYQNNGALGYYLEKNIDAGPQKNEGENKVLNTGIHLHWVMPDAFRKGKHATDGTFGFPVVPNRWLVIRTNAGDQLKSWVVQSDYLNTSVKAKYNYIKEDVNDRSLKAIKMGKAFELQAWTEDSTKAAIDKLTIMAPGNPEFAASYMHCKEVFGFYDDMLDANRQPAADGAEFSYQVYGWYADKEQDPLHDVKNLISLTSKLNNLSWMLEDKSALRGDLPHSTVCYAMVHTVTWKNNPQNHIPSSGIKIGIGNTASEALASLLPGETKTMSANIPQKLLAAYQFKSLVDNGIEGNGLDILKKKLHARSFLPVEAGVQWVVQPPEKNAGDNSNETDDKSLEPFNLAVSADLLELNNLQAEYNIMADELASLQAELYALKFKHVFSETDDSNEGSFSPKQWAAIKDKVDKEITLTRANITDLINKLGLLLSSKLTAQKNEIKDAGWPDDYNGSIVSQYKKLLASMKTAGMKDYEVQKIAAPQYYEPVDPAVVITGLVPSKKYLKSSANNLGAANDEGKLKCRTRYLLANKLTNNEQYITADRIYPEAIAALFKQIDTKNIPAGIKDLVSESLLLNPLMGSEISRISHWDIDTIKDLILNFNQRSGSYKRVEDNDLPAWLPPINAVSVWQQPWTPLYLEWAVNWQKLQGAGDALSGWKFGDEKNRIDFKYGASLKNYKGDEDTTAYYGRTLLSSQFAEKVKGLNKTIEKLFKTDMFNEFMPMAQSLGGFSTQLIQRYHGVQLPIVDADDETLIVDSDYSLMGNQNSWRPMIVNRPFTPIRGGLLRVTMLRVIDSFGQALNVLPLDKMPGAKRRIFKSSAGLRTGGDINKFELEPRIIQPSRLRFDWVSAKDATRVTDSDPATSPVCGWLLYNALDNNIAVYEASGIEIGYFVKSSVDSQVKLVVPMGSNRLPTSSNPALKSVMDFIRLNPNNFDGICRQIDAVTKKIQAKYSRQQLTMALPTGFPMAVVSAQFLIELKGLAARDQSWKSGLSSQKFDPVKYAVTIGNAANKTDGLVGYFLNDNYSRFMVSAGEKNVPLKFKSAPADKFPIGEMQKITLLMDPRTMITITSGLVPMANYELPQHAISKVLKKINIRILAAPILTPVGKVKMPLLKSNDVNWNFVSPLYSDEPLIAEEATSPLTYEDIQATEGWLTIVNKTPGSN